jgi:hypothetical protein
MYSSNLIVLRGHVKLRSLHYKYDKNITAVAAASKFHYSTNPIFKNSKYAPPTA